MLEGLWLRTSQHIANTLSPLTVISCCRIVLLLYPSAESQLSVLSQKQMQGSDLMIYARTHTTNPQL